MATIYEDEGPGLVIQSTGSSDLVKWYGSTVLVFSKGMKFMPQLITAVSTEISPEGLFI
jgi:hypothetical protein